MKPSTDQEYPGMETPTLFMSGLALVFLVAGWLWACADKAKARLKRSFRRICFRLTTHVDCAWCKRRLHVAPFPGHYELSGIKFPKISRAICPACFELEKLRLRSFGKSVSVKVVVE